MSGSGNHDSQRERALGGKIKEEVLSALKLLFKNAEQHAVSLLLEPSLTIYPTEIPGECTQVAIKKPEAEVSADPIRILQQRELPVGCATLITEAQLAEAAPCHVEPSMCHEPVYDEMVFASHGITFNNLLTVNTSHWAIERLRTKAMQQTIEKIAKPTVGATEGGPIKANISSLQGRLRPTNAKSDPRFYALPIRKTAIPPHRFGVEAREAFRKALAEKAKTYPANVQLKAVFERMHMALYNSIQPDDLGNLLCVPKSELLGRNRETPASQAVLNQQTATKNATYLVIGIRLDNKEDIRTLVPVDTILNATPNGGD